MLIRRELPGDAQAIAAVHADAFPPPPGGGVPVEVGLVDGLRSSAAWIPQLSFVAVDAGAIVGHVVCSRATVDDRFDALGLGPLGVLASRQRSGVGLALMHAVLGAADALEEPLVALLGSNLYYPRFGFEPALAHGIEPPEDWYGEHFQVRVLTAHRPEIRGRFRYAAAFDDM